MEYYTAEQAMKLLGKKRSTFYRDVELGNIPSELIPGSTRLRFPKEPIDYHVKQMRASEKEKKKKQFVRSSNADLWVRITRSRQVYGEDDSVPYERAIEWPELVGGDIFMSLKEGKTLIGASTLMPLDEEIILALARDEIRERDIPDEAFRKWTDPQLSVYAATIAIMPSGNKKTDKDRGTALIRHTIMWGIELQMVHDIKNWYGIGVTQEGQEILEHLGFEKFLDLGERKAYRLDDISRGTKMFRRYLERLNMQATE